jgi:hypothetical protein
MTEPYFKKYTDLIPADTELVQLLDAQGQQFVKWLHSISEGDSILLHAPYTWTLREVINHLTDGERVFSYRALWIARGGPMPMISFDENEFSLRAKANRTTLKQLTDEFDSVRKASVSLFRGLPTEDWSCIGQAAGHEISVTHQATILVGHVAHHWNILNKRFPNQAI